MDKLTIYDLTDSMAAIEAALESFAEANDGLVHPELDEMLDGVLANRADKFDSIVALMRNNKATIEGLKAKYKAIKAEAERWNTKAKYLESQNEQLRGHVLKTLQLGEKHKSNFCSIFWRTVQDVEVTNIDALPEFLVEKKPKISLIKSELKSGADVPGTQKVSKAHLTIK